MENKEYIEKEFKEFVETLYDHTPTIEDRPFGFYSWFYVPGEISQEEFEEDMKEFCDRYGARFELVDQAPEAPSRQYFLKNMKLVFPSVKNFEILSKNPNKLELAKKLFKLNWNQSPNLELEEDQEDLVLLYNMHMEELREWKLVLVNIYLPQEEPAYLIFSVYPQRLHHLHSYPF